MNFSDKYIWTCPLCNKQFKSYKSAFNTILKKKNILLLIIHQILFLLEETLNLKKVL